MIDQRYLKLHDVIYTIVAENDVELVLSQESGLNIHIDKNSSRYKSILASAIFSTDHRTNKSQYAIKSSSICGSDIITPAEYASDKIYKVFGILSSGKIGKHSVTELVLRHIDDNKEDFDFLVALYLFVYLYTERKRTAQVFSFEVIVKLLRDSSIVYKLTSGDTIRRAVSILKSVLSGESRVAVKDLICYFPESSKFLLGTALAGYHFESKFNLVKKDIYQVVSRISDLTGLPSQF